MTSEKILGPHFITESVTSDVYNEFLRSEFSPQIDEYDLRDHHFQQDGAPPHTTRENLELSRENFGPRVIARRFPDLFSEGLAWPPYSPDLSPLDFFLWGYVKDKVYKNNPKTISELKTAVGNIIRDVPADMLQKSIGSFERRCRMLIHTNGQHIENILH